MLLCSAWGVQWDSGTVNTVCSGQQQTDKFGSDLVYVDVITTREGQ